MIGIPEANARNTITEKGLRVKVNHLANADVEQGLVYRQSPDAGTRVEKETRVVIDVSTGKPQVTIPNVVGKDQTEAVKELTEANLDARVVEVSANEKEGTVTGQFPRATTVVVTVSPSHVAVRWSSTCAGWRPATLRPGVGGSRSRRRRR